MKPRDGVHREPTATNQPTPRQPFVDSKEDQNSIGECPVSEAKIAAMKAKVQSWLAPGQPGHTILLSSASSSPSPPLKICLLDGFLLYAAPTTALGSTVPPLLDVRLFLRVSLDRARARREARDGYVTLEGFWTDPPGYVDQIVWPNYVASHAWLFENGAAERGRLDADVLAEHEIRAVPLKAGQEQDDGAGADVDVDVDMETTFEWAVETLMSELGTLVGVR